MRPLFLSLGGILAAGVTFAQNAGDSGGSGNLPQLPVGQTFKQFEFPVYQEGKLRYTLNAIEARGITLNRAETINLTIDIYENGKKTTTITSPKADLYAAEQKMRTKNTVMIDRDDMRATSQTCDFDVKLKRYLLRSNVKVTLKHFDMSSGTDLKKPTTSQTKGSAASAPAPDLAPVPSSTPAPVPEMPLTAPSADSLPTSPAPYADTNSAPILPARPESK